MNTIPKFNVNYFYMNIGASSTKTKNVTQNNLKLLKATTTSTYKRPLQNEDNATKRCNTLGIFHY
jgi:hypothetical protein